MMNGGTRTETDVASSRRSRKAAEISQREKRGWLVKLRERGIFWIKRGEWMDGCGREKQTRKRERAKERRESHSLLLPPLLPSSPSLKQIYYRSLDLYETPSTLRARIIKRSNPPPQPVLLSSLLRPPPFPIQLLPSFSFPLSLPTLFPQESKQQQAKQTKPKLT